MKIQTERYTNGFTQQQLHLLVETRVTDVDQSAAATVAALAALAPVEKEWFASEGDEQRFRLAAAEQAREAGRTGEPIDKSLMAKARGAAQVREDLSLELEAARAHVAACHQRHMVALGTHAKELAALADAEVSAALVALAGAARMARGGGAQLDVGLAARNGIAGLQRGESITPRVPLAPRPEFGEAGAPGVFIDVAAENLGKSMHYTSQIVDAFRSEAKALRLANGLSDADDLDDDDDEADDA